MHCVGSNVGSAMIDGVSKHNARNPDNRILYLNCGALAIELTNEQRDFWHFRELCLVKIIGWALRLTLRSCSGTP